MRLFSLLVIGQALILCHGGVAAQAGTTNTISVRRAGTPPYPSITPPFPTMKSPVAFFRELLALTPAERTQLLADRTPENRRAILAKVREYESMKQRDCDLRLRVTELRWYLMPFLRSPSTNWPAQLKLLPTDYQKQIQQRLQLWEKLPESSRQELLDNEATIRYMLETQGTTPPPQPSPSTLSPARKKMLEEGIAQWQQQPEEVRQKQLARFRQFFDLSPGEKLRTLNQLSELERRAIEKTLRDYETLSPEQRAHCVRSFEKFTNMSLEERQQFLKNADRWKLMSEEERKAWRNVVSTVSLLPNQSGPPLPPPIPGRSPPRAPLATNH